MPKKKSSTGKRGENEPSSVVLEMPKKKSSTGKRGENESSFPGNPLGQIVPEDNLGATPNFPSNSALSTWTSYDTTCANISQPDGHNPPVYVPTAATSTGQKEGNVRSRGEDKVKKKKGRIKKLFSLKKTNTPKLSSVSSDSHSSVGAQSPGLCPSMDEDEQEESDASTIISCEACSPVEVEEDCAREEKKRMEKVMTQKSENMKLKTIEAKGKITERDHTLYKQYKDEPEDSRRRLELARKETKMFEQMYFEANQKLEDEGQERISVGLALQAEKDLTRELEQRTLGLESELTEIKAELKETRDTKLQSQATIANLAEEGFVVRKENTKAKSDLDKLKVSQESCQAQLLATEEELLKKTEVLEKSNEAIVKLEEENLQFRQDLEELTFSQNVCRAQLQKKEKELFVATQELEKSKEAIVKLEDENFLVRQENVKALEKLTSQDACQAQLQVKLQELDESKKVIVKLEDENFLVRQENVKALEKQTSQDACQAQLQVKLLKETHELEESKKVIVKLEDENLLVRQENVKALEKLTSQDACQAQLQGKLLKETHELDESKKVIVKLEEENFLVRQENVKALEKQTSQDACQAQLQGKLLKETHELEESKKVIVKLEDENLLVRQENVKALEKLTSQDACQAQLQGKLLKETHELEESKKAIVKLEEDNFLVRQENVKALEKQTSQDACQAQLQVKLLKETQELEESKKLIVKLEEENLLLRQENVKALEKLTSQDACQAQLQGKLLKETHELDESKKVIVKLEDENFLVRQENVKALEKLTSQDACQAQLQGKLLETHELEESKKAIVKLEEENFLVRQENVKALEKLTSQDACQAQLQGKLLETHELEESKKVIVKLEEENFLVRQENVKALAKLASQDACQAQLQVKLLKETHELEESKKAIVKLEEENLRQEKLKLSLDSCRAQLQGREDELLKETQELFKSKEAIVKLEEEKRMLQQELNMVLESERQQKICQETHQRKKLEEVKELESESECRRNLEHVQLITPTSSGVFPFPHQLYKLVDFHREFTEVLPHTLALEKTRQILIDLGINLPDFKTRGYVVAVFRAANPIQSLLLDYTCTGNGDGGVFDEGARGGCRVFDEDFPNADYESPHTSLNEVVHSLTVNEDNMTDTVKLKLQQELVESQQELELLREKNQTLLEAVELEGDSRVKKLQEANMRLTDKYLSLHGEKMHLFEKVKERDDQLRDLREAGVVMTDSRHNACFPNVQRSLSVGEVTNLTDPIAEVDRLRIVIECKSKKIDNLTMQLNSFQDVASGNVSLQSDVTELKAKLEEAEAEVKRAQRESERHLIEVDKVKKKLLKVEEEKLDVKDHTDVWEKEVEGAKENISRLEAEVATLTNYRDYWQSRCSIMEKDRMNVEKEQMNVAGLDTVNPGNQMHQSEVKNLEGALKREHAEIERLNKCLETGNKTNCDLLKENKSLSADVVEYEKLLVEKEQYYLQYVEHKVQSLKKELDDLMKENIVLKDENEARKVEATNVKEDFNEERKAREEMTSKMHGELEILKVQERNLNEKISYLQEQVDHLGSDRDGILLISQQQKVEFDAKLLTRDDLLEKEKENCMRSKEERNEMMKELNRVTELYQSLREKSKKAEDSIHMLNISVQKMKGDIDLVRVEKQSLCEQVEKLEDDLRRNEGNYKSQLQELETHLKKNMQQLAQEKECLTVKLKAMDVLRRELFANLQVEKQRVDEGITTASRLSDDVFTKNQVISQYEKDIDSFKSQLSGERSTRQQLEHALQENHSKLRDMEHKLLYVQECFQKSREQHKEEMEWLRAQCGSDKQNVENDNAYMKRELEQLRSQKMSEGGYAETYKNLEAEMSALKRKIADHEVEYISLMNNYMELKKIAVDRGIIIPTDRSTEPSCRPRDPIPLSEKEVCPYAATEMSIHSRHPQEVASGHHLGRTLTMKCGGAQLEYPKQVDRVFEGGREEERIRPSKPSMFQENILMKNIDYNISEAALYMRDGRDVVEKSLRPVEDARPMDSNLICPICGCQFRIGQIQNYRYHVNICGKRPM